MSDRYQTLFGASRPALDPALAGPEWVEEGIFLRNTRTGERRLKEIPGGQRATTAVPAPLILVGAYGAPNLGALGDIAKEAISGLPDRWREQEMGLVDLAQKPYAAIASATKWAAPPRSPQEAHALAFGPGVAAVKAEPIDNVLVEGSDLYAEARRLTKEQYEAAQERLAAKTDGLPPVGAALVEAGTEAVATVTEPSQWLLGGVPGKRALAKSPGMKRYVKLFGEAAGTGRPMARTIEKKLFEGPSVDPLTLDRATFERPVYEGPTVDPLTLERPVHDPAQLGAGIEPLILRRRPFEGPSVEPLTLERPVFDRGLPAEAAPAAPDLAGGLPDTLPARLAGLSVAAGRGVGRFAVEGEAALQKGYGKLQDLDEADALLRDNLNRYPGYRRAYYEDRLDKVELDLQRLREAEDATPRGFSPTGPARIAAAHEPIPMPPLTGKKVSAKDADAIAASWEVVARRHPRIAEHVRELRIDPSIGEDGAGAMYADGVISGESPFWLKNPSILAHELTHAAQDARHVKWGTLRREVPAYLRGGVLTYSARPSVPSPGIDLLKQLEEVTDQELARRLRTNRALHGSFEGVAEIRLRNETQLLGQEIQRRSQLRGYTSEDVLELMNADLPPGTKELQELSIDNIYNSESKLARLKTARAAPPGPEAQGGIATSSGILPETVASPPLSGQVAESLDGLRPSSAASPPLGPRPGSGESGFIKFRPDPLPPADAAAKEAAWQMRKEYAATERLGRYRAGARAEELQKLIPKETDEALTWMFHELGDPRAYANRPAEVAARIAKKPGARRRVVEQIFADPNAESALQEVASWREQTRQMWDDLSDMWDLGFVKNYMHMTYEPPKGIGPKDSFRRLSATPSMTRSRTFMNPAEAMAAGYTPRTLRFSQLRAETEKVFAHAQAVRDLVDDLGKMPLLQDGRPPLVYATAGKQPQKYVHVPEWAWPVFDAAARRSTTSNRALPEAVAHAGALQDESRRAAETAAGYFRYNPEGHAVPSVLEQPLLPGTEGLGPRTFRPPRTPTTPEDLWVHPEIWKELRPVLDHAEPLAIDKFIAITKRIKFLGSIFHPFELGLASAQSMGPVKGAKAWAQHGGGIPGIAQLAEKKQWATPFTREVEEKWVRAGLGIEAPSADMMTDAFSRALVDFEDVMKRFSGTPFARPAKGAELAGRGLRETAAYYDEAIWGMHKKVKVAAAEQWESQIREALNGDRGAMGVANRFLGKKTRERLAAMSEDEIREEISGAINNHFGGQVWELKRNALLSDPRFVKWARRIWISPDWNVSAVSSGLAPLSGDPVHRIIGRTYWTNIGALAAGFAMLNYALTAGSEKGPHFPWDNEEGHKMDLETPFRTKPTEHNTGRIIHYRVGKHAQELPHLVWGKPVAQQLKFLAGKTAPWVGAAAGLMGKSVTEFPSPYEELVREREKTGEVPGPVEDIVSRLEPTAEMALPFSLQDAEDPGDVLRKLLISIPESKGMSTYKAENLFAQALYENDSPRQTEIIQILRQNGYDDEAIGFMIQGAKRKAKRRLRAGR